MASHSRILNITRGFRLKPSQAYRAIENCACVWVEVGVSIRDLSLAESIAFRNEQAKIREPLAYSELPNVKYSGTTNYELIKAAHEFCASAV